MKKIKNKLNINDYGMLIHLSNDLRETSFMYKTKLGQVNQHLLKLQSKYIKLFVVSEGNLIEIRYLRLATRINGDKVFEFIQEKTKHGFQLHLGKLKKDILDENIIFILDKPKRIRLNFRR